MPSTMKQQNPKLKTYPFKVIMVLFIGIFGLIISMFIAISLGAANITFSTVWEAIFHLDMKNTEHQIIHEIRIPRVIGAALVGTSFAVAGAMMQGITRNPLADSGLLGINAGATFMLAICFAFFPHLSYTYVILYAFLGAALGAILVFGIGMASKKKLSPLRLVLAGAAVGALLMALGEGIALHFEVGQDLAFWFAGGVSGTTWAHLKVIAPWVVIASIGAIILSKSITVISFGDEIAMGLGQKVTRIKIFSLIIVLILAGGAVSVVGAVGFVGLIVPHLMRYLVGHDYRWIISGSIIYGAWLVVLADCLARTLKPPYEIPIGALIALIGVPFFLYIARKRGREL
nr:iron ABC transporter permease [Metasolibacillus meyeri]